MATPLRVLVVGCGNMGASHARAYHKMDGFEIVGLVSRGPESRNRLSEELGGYPTYGSIQEGLAAAKPDCVSINTYPDTHAEYIRLSLAAGAHIFVEKPLAETVEECLEIKRMVEESGKKLVVGYILRVHPAWAKFIEVARTLGKPLVMRMNLNQQSHGATWDTHKSLMQSMSPIVDCGVHYVDVMCLMTQSRPIRVSGIGARLSDEIKPDMYNYGQLQVTFEDGSVGWYEAGWGPMISETAYFIKDVIGPEGCVSISDAPKSTSDDVDAHSKTNALRLHRAAVSPNGGFAQTDEMIDTTDEPDHQGLCNLEQEYFLRAIQEDLDLSQHLEDAINSLRIVLAADESFKTGQTITL
ncbi:MAG: Gfo/Idh/MocA family oxidoreductase [Bacteroidota bacterium]